MMRDAAEVTFVEDPEGVVRMEVLTRDRLPVMRHPERPVPPEEYLQHVGVAFMTVGHRERDPVTGVERDAGWRYVRMSVLAGSPMTGPEYVRYVDLAADGDERRLFETLAGQDSVRIVWLNERVEATLELPQDQRDSWREALAATRGVGREDWDAELTARMRAELPGFTGGRSKPPRRRRAHPPEAPIPFFAERSGPIPRAGRATVADMRLPRGDRRPAVAPAFWATTDAVPDAGALCSRLAAAFPGTGLWPVLWAWPEPPEAYFAGGEDLDGIDGVDAAAILRAAWERDPRAEDVTAPLGPAFPGPAAASALRDRHDPFEGRAASPHEVAGDAAPRVLLVPCNRPADAPAALGWDTEELSAVQISAVLRSWEERFGAILVELAPSTLTLSVAAPPTTLEQGLALAVEHEAFAPSPDVNRPGGLAELARILIGERRNFLTSLHVGPRLWQLGLD